MLTSVVRSRSGIIGKQKARRREEEQKAIAELNECERDMCTDPCDDNVQRCQTLRKKIDDRVRKREESDALVWGEVDGAGEKPSKYFLRMCANKVAESNECIIFFG